MRTLVLLSVLLVGGVAHADSGGVWTPIEARLRLLKPVDTKPGILWQVWSEWWFTDTANGLSLAELHTGPMLEVNKYFNLALRGAYIIEKDSKGIYEQEPRAELEPTIKWRAWRFSFSYRNRLEFRWRGTTIWPTDGWKFRDRNMFRVNYDPEGGKWLVGVSDELFLDLAGAWVTENRFQALVGWKFGKDSKVEVGYMLRSKHGNSGATTTSLDHFFVLSLLLQPEAL